MAAGRNETHGGRRKWVVWGDLYGKQPEAARVWGAVVTRTFEDCFPGEEVRVGGGTKVEDAVRRLGAEGGDFVV